MSVAPVMHPPMTCLHTPGEFVISVVRFSEYALNSQTNHPSHELVEHSDCDTWLGQDALRFCCCPTCSNDRVLEHKRPTSSALQKQRSMAKRIGTMLVSMSALDLRSGQLLVIPHTLELVERCATGVEGEEADPQHV